jgi:hypothetical protein
MASSSEFSIAAAPADVVRSIWTAGTVKRITFFEHLTLDCFYLLEDSPQRDVMLAHLSDSPFYVVAFHVLQGSLKVVQLLCPFGIALFRIHQTADFLHQFIRDISTRDVWFMWPESTRSVLQRDGFRIGKSSIAARFADRHADVCDSVCRCDPWKLDMDVPLELNYSFLTIGDVLRIVFWPLCPFHTMAPASLSE